jgi:hypothetical protein
MKDRKIEIPVPEGKKAEVRKDGSRTIIEFVDDLPKIEIGSWWVHKSDSRYTVHVIDTEEDVWLVVHTIPKKKHMSYKIECNPESHEVYIKDENGRVVHHSTTREQQLAALALFMEESRKLQSERDAAHKEIERLKSTMQIHAGDIMSANNEMDRFRGMYEEEFDRAESLQKELEELKAKLPKTADGVLILPDDVTVCGEYPHFPNTWDMRTRDGRRISEHNELQYSSWKAAEQAAREAGEGAK